MGEVLKYEKRSRFEDASINLFLPCTTLRLLARCGGELFGRREPCACSFALFHITRLTPSLSSTPFPPSQIKTRHINVHHRLPRIESEKSSAFNTAKTVRRACSHS